METRKITMVEEINVGSEFSLGKNERILLGSSSASVSGHTVYHVKGAESGGYLSSYGIEIYHGREGEIIVQKPDLTVGGEPYISKNKIIITDTLGKTETIDRVYNAGVGLNLSQIEVKGDDGSNFVVEVIGSDTFKLSSVLIAE